MSSNNASTRCGEAGQAPDPRRAQLATLRETIGALTERLGRQDATITEVTEFKAMALSRLAAQPDEILRLRASVAARANVHTLPARPHADRQPTRWSPQPNHCEYPQWITECPAETRAEG